MGVAGRQVAPKEIHIPGTCEHIMLRGQRDLAGVMKDVVTGMALL